MDWSTVPVWNVVGAGASIVVAVGTSYTAVLLKREHTAAKRRELASKIYVPLYKSLDSEGTYDRSGEPALAEKWSKVRRDNPHLKIPSPLRNALDAYSSAKGKFVERDILFHEERKEMEGTEIRHIVPDVESKAGRPPDMLRIRVDKNWTGVTINPWTNWLEDASFDSRLESERAKYRGKEADVEIHLHGGASIKSLTKAREYVTTVQANYEQSDEAKQIKRQFAQMRTLREDVRALLNAEFARLKRYQ